MNIRYIKVDTSGIELQLQRIADLLEGILTSTTDKRLSTQWASELSEEEQAARVSYSDDRLEIVEYQLGKLGKEYKPKS